MRQSLVTVTAALIVGSGLVAGSATAYTAEIPAQSSPQPMETTVPKCLHDKEDKGTFYTTIWVASTGKRHYRIQLIMARGADNRCFSIEPGQTRSNSSRGASPYLDRIILC